MPERIHHRGLDKEGNAGKPNSFESYRDRRQQQVELDVFLLADGNIGVVHNKDMGRTQEEIEHLTREQLELLPVIDRETGEEAMAPRFEEFVLGSLDRGNGLLLELKGSSPEKAAALARAVVARVAELSRIDRTFREHPEYVQQLGVHSFSVEALEAAGEANSEQGVDMPRGLFWASSPDRTQEMEISKTAVERSGYQEGDDWTMKGVDLAGSLGVDSINLHWSAVTPEVVRAAHERNLEVFAWVVNTEDKIQELEALGVDRVITES